MLVLFSTLAQMFRGLFLLVSYISSDSFPQPLNVQEEKYYLDLLQQGDEEARKILIERNLRLVAHVVKKFENTGEDKEDLISIGTIGLIKAINTFNFKKGARLATYAAKCIENEILMHIRSKKKNKQEVSLNEPLETSKDGNEITLEDMLGSSADEVMDQVETFLMAEKLKRIIKKLKPRERKILHMRYGLGNQKKYTQKEVAARLGISRSYVSRIEKKIIGKLYEEFKIEY